MSSGRRGLARPVCCAFILLLGAGVALEGAGCSFDRSGLLMDGRRDGATDWLDAALHDASGGDARRPPDGHASDAQGIEDAQVPTDAPVSAVCGDGIAQGGEQCDLTDLGGQDCASQGFDAGELRCTGACQLDAALCYDIPSDWYDPAWGARWALLIDHTRVARDFASFPVLVSITDPMLAGLGRADGGDLLFTAGDGLTQLPHELERYDPATGRLIAWVKVPNLSSTADTVIYLYGGNPTAADQQDPPSVWDAGFEAVWHLSEPAQDESSGAVHVDATGHGHDGAQAGNAAGAGRIGGGQVLDGDDDEILAAQSSGFQLGNADCTVSAWIRTASSSDMGVVVKGLAGSHEHDDKLLGVNHGAEHLGVDQGWVTYLEAPRVVTDDQWHHVAWVQVLDAQGASEAWRLYVDGARVAEKAADTHEDPPGHTLRIGGRIPESYFAHRFAGILDEVRVSHVARDDGWIATGYANQSAPGAFLSVAPVEQLGP